jgi:hypothetical protein
MLREKGKRERRLFNVRGSARGMRRYTGLVRGRNEKETGRWKESEIESETGRGREIGTWKWRGRGRDEVVHLVAKEMRYKWITLVNWPRNEVLSQVTTDRQSLENNRHGRDLITNHRDQRTNRSLHNQNGLHHNRVNLPDMGILRVVLLSMEGIMHMRIQNHDILRRLNHSRWLPSMVPLRTSMRRQ